MRRESKLFLFLFSLLIGLFLLPNQVFATAKTDVGVTFTESPMTSQTETSTNDTANQSKPEGNAGKPSGNLPSMGDTPLIISANLLGLTFLFVLFLLIKVGKKEVRRDE